MKTSHLSIFAFALALTFPFHLQSAESKTLEDFRDAAAKANALGVIFLMAPTSSDARIAAIDRASDDFIYYVSTMGVTGARSKLDPALLERLDEVGAKVHKPLAVGFGISKHEHYLALRDRCDAVVVGSAIVRAIADGDANGAPERAAAVVRGILQPA